MSDTLSSPSPSLASVRFREPYVSQGLNKKLNGVIPRGIVRGGKLETVGAGLNIKIVADAETGDSVYSYVDLSGHQITFRQEGDVNLDLSGVAGLPTDIYIALFIDYTVSNNTVVEWRAYTIAELTTAPVAEATFVIVLGRVAAPGAGPISASAFSPELRRVAWEDRSIGMESWHQIVENGQWDFAATETVSGTTLNHIIGWSEVTLFTANYTWRIVQTAPRSGAQELEILGDGASTEVLSMFGDRQAGIRAGQLVRVRYYIRGAAWGGIGGAGVQGLQLNFYDKDKQQIATEFVSDATLTGNFGYTLIDGLVEAPANTAFMCYAIRLDTNGATPSGSIFFDDIRVWTEASQALNEDAQQRLGFNTGVSGPTHLTPAFAAGATITDAIEDTLRVENGSFNGAVGIIAAEMMGAAAKGFDVTATGMGLRVQRLISALGAHMLSNDTDKGEPRIEWEHSETGFTLLWQSLSEGGNEAVRLYARSATSGAYFILTGNARRNNATNMWVRDTPGLASWQFEIERDKFEYSQAAVAAGDPFASFTTHFFRLETTGFGLRVEIDDGHLQFQNPTINSSNPRSTTVPVLNTLYAKNICKAFGGYTITAGAAATLRSNESYNILSTTNLGPVGVTVFFRQPMSDDSYLIATVTGGINIGVGTEASIIYMVSQGGGNDGDNINIFGPSVNAPGSFADFSDAGYTDEVYFHVMGEQT